MNGIVRSLLFVTAIGLLAVVLICASDDSEALDYVENKVNFNPDEVVVYYAGNQVGPLTDINVSFALYIVDKTGYHNVTINGVPYDYDESGHIILPAERDSGILIQAEKIQYSINYETTVEVSGTFPEDPTFFTIDSILNIPLPLFSRAGYRLDGWNTSDNGTGNNITLGNHTIDADFIENYYGSNTNMILYPKWVRSEYSIVFNLNNGTGQLPVIISNQLVDEEVTIPTVGLSRIGYTATTWYASSNENTLTINPGEMVMGQSTVDEYCDVNGMITLYPKWVKNEYSIRFDSTVEMKGALPETMNYNIGSPLNIPTSQLTRVGYVISGWNTSADRSGLDLQPGDYSVDTAFLERYYGPSDRNLILYPKWIPVDYSITLSSEFGSASEAGWSVTDGKLSRSYNIESEMISLPIPEPDDRFHLFVNWEDSEGNSVSRIATGTVGNIELKAAWIEKSYPITARISGKEVTFDLTLSSEMPYAEPEDGFAFKGWYYRDDEGNEVKFESMSQMTENMEIYAVFEPTQDDPLEIAACVIGIVVFFTVVIGYGFTRE